jgi:hypothetical protein
MAISTAPADDPAIILRRGFGFSFFEGGCVLRPMFGTGPAVVDAIVGELFGSTALVAIFTRNKEPRWYRGVNASRQLFEYMEMLQ